MFDETLLHFEFFCKIYRVFDNIGLLLSKMSENKSREERTFFGKCYLPHQFPCDISSILEGDILLNGCPTNKNVLSATNTMNLTGRSMGNTEFQWQRSASPRFDGSNSIQIQSGTRTMLGPEIQESGPVRVIALLR